MIPYFLHAGFHGNCNGRLHLTFTRLFRLDFYDDYYTQLFENDPNLNAGFDIEAFRQHQLDLHNYYRYKSGVPLMTLDYT